LIKFLYILLVIKTLDEGLKKTVEWYIEHLKWAQDKVAYLNDYWKRVYVRQ